MFTFPLTGPCWLELPTLFGRHQTCCCRKHASSAAAELGGKIYNVSRNRARAQVLLQARKLHVYGNVAPLVHSGSNRLAVSHNRKHP